MAIEQDDWRLQGQERYLKGLTLTYKKYYTLRASWDHDHCEFCGDKFSVEIPDCLTEGYTTKDDYHWICSKCFEDFKVMFGWMVD